MDMEIITMITSLSKELNRMKNYAIHWLSKSGVTALRTQTLDRYLEIEFDRNKLLREIFLIQNYGIDPNNDFLRYRNSSTSQLGQDLWVLIASRFQRTGTFIEIGGGDGILFSNTYLLEKQLGWSGVIVEPAKIWQENLKRNRNCQLELRCCSGVSGLQIEFLETPSPMLSTIQEYRYKDSHAKERKTGKTYQVESVTLNEIFIQHFPSGHVNYISIDTEGSEEDILQNFDFDRFSFDFATIENAFDAQKSERITELLRSKGYRRVLEEVSEFDNYYERISK